MPLAGKRRTQGAALKNHHGAGSMSILGEHQTVYSLTPGLWLGTVMDSAWPPRHGANARNCRFPRS
jgi:hypothetical protein